MRWNTWLVGFSYCHVCTLLLGSSIDFSSLERPELGTDGGMLPSIQSLHSKVTTNGMLEKFLGPCFIDGSIDNIRIPQRGERKKAYSRTTKMHALKHSASLLRNTKSAASSISEPKSMVHSMYDDPKLMEQYVSPKQTIAFKVEPPVRCYAAKKTSAWKTQNQYYHTLRCFNSLWKR